MRNLTIKREKSFVGCLLSSKIYVQNDELGDTKINGEKCFKLGTLKNGEEKTFTIDDCETKIYVIQDKLSRNMCNEMCIIPAGTENIYLMGENKYNPFGGNGFRFHGMTDPRVLANRKKSSKRFGIYIAICVVIGIICGFLSGYYDSLDCAKDGEPYAFIDETGVKVTLTDAFVDSDIDGFDLTYTAEDVVVLGFEDKFTILEGLEDYSLKEYGELSIRSNELDSKVEKKNDITYYEYKNYVEDQATNYIYFAAVYKTEDSFWTITFAVDELQYEEYKPYFFEWAKSVEFVEE